MMLKLIQLFLFLIFPTFLYAQSESPIQEISKDTTYFSDAWFITTKNNAKYYRLTPLKTDSGYIIKDYYISGNLQMKGLSENIDNMENLVLKGVATWYYENKKLNQIAHYNNGDLDGLFQVFNENGEKVSELIYKQNTPVKGYQTSIFNYYNIKKVYDNENLIQTEVYSNDNRSKAKIEIVQENDKYKSIRYFDINGKLLGQTNDISENNNINNGMLVYYSMAPMVVNRISYYQNEKIKNPITEYFTNGKPKYYEFLDEENNVTKRFYLYNIDKPSDTLYFKDGSPENGTLITYFNNDSNSYENDYIQSIIHYKNGNYDGEAKEFYKENKLKKYTKYDNNGYEREVTYYNTKGQVIGKLNTDTDQYLSGTKYEFDLNDSIEKITIYDKDKILKCKLFKEGKPLYDINYNGLSKFYDLTDNKEYSCIYKNNEPVEGTEIEFDTYENFITEIKSFKNGLLEGTKLSYEYNSEQDTNELILEETYKKGIKEGIEKTYYHGKLIKTLTYKNGLKDGEGNFYENNNSSKKCIFKNDQPYEGYVYDYDEINNYKTISKYKNGLLQDTVFTIYSDSIVKLEIYNAGEQIKTISFDNTGKQYVLIYKNNEPYDGSKIESYKESIYKKGALEVLKKYNEDYELITKEEYSSGSCLVTEFFKDGKTKAIYHKIDGYVEGKYQTFGVTGNLITEGIYKNNKPFSGKFAFYSSEDENKYILISLSDNLYKAIEYNDNKVIKQIEYKIIQVEEENNEKENFILMLISCFKDYNFDSFNYIY
jgi:uncharacterized protein